MFAFTYTAALLAILFAVCAAFLLTRFRHRALAVALAFEFLSGAFWIGSNAGADVAYTPAMNIAWSGLCFIGGLLILSFFLLFVEVFTKGDWPSRARIALYMAPSILMAPLAFSTYSIVDTIFPPNAPSAIVPGPLYYGYLLFFFIAVVYGLARLIRYYFNASGNHRYQAAYIILGSSLFFAGLITFNVILPLFGELRFFNVGPQFAAVFLAACVYAIFKYQLLDIRVLLQRGLIFSILFALVVTVYVSGLLYVESMFGFETGTAAHLSAALVLIIGIFTVPPLERAFKKITDPWFFKDSYCYSQTLEQLSTVLNNTVELKPLVESSLTTLAEAMRLQGVELRQMRDGSTFRVHAEELQELGAPALCVPVSLGDGEQLGELCVGEKLSGDPIRAEDAALLRTFAAQLGIALKKAELYQQLKEYSLTLEQKVAERTARLERMQNHQREMIDDASHELQTPLAIIKTTVELLMREKIGDAFRADLAMIDRSVDSLTRLVSNLLHLARLETETDKIRHTEFDLSALARSIIEYTEVICESAQITLHASIEDGISFFGRRELIEEVITNLLSNAVKYTRNAPERHVHFTLRADAGTIEVKVVDSGAGIAPEDIPHLFKRFYRSQTQAGVTRGTGLGLAICKRIAKQHGGKIFAESGGIGTGSTFTVQLPRQRPRGKK